MADATTSIASNEIEIFTYSHEGAIRGTTKVIFTLGLSLSFGECPPVVSWIRKSYNPNCIPIKRETIIEEAKIQFAKLKKELESTLASLSHKVSLACDVWHNSYDLNHIRITAHWIDSDWCMHRRIINFKTIDLDPSYDYGISYRVKKSIESWSIREKTFSVTVDDVSDDADAMEDLKNFIHPILDVKLFRVRCVCRVLSSCILDDLDLISGEPIRKIRRGVGCLLHQRESYINLCEKYGLEPKFIVFWGDLYSWDRTRNMLKMRLQYKDVINEYNATHRPEYDEITEQDWEITSVYIKILDVFYEAVEFVSRNYYPSSSGVLLHLVNIGKVFSEYRGSHVFEEKFSVMEENFLKHYDRIPDLFCLAAVMDPRIKLSGCECLLESYYQCTNRMNVNVEEEKIQISRLLLEMFNQYASQFSRVQIEPSASFSASGFAWSLIDKKRQKTADSGFNELAFYLQTPHAFEQDFDILGWWKKHEIIYPVLATMARDLLTTPVSTLAPDCAFSRNGERKITDESYKLGWRKLEMYSCLRDWYNAEYRSQGERDLDDDDEDDQLKPDEEDLED